MTVTMTAPRTGVDPGGMPSPPDPEVPEKAKRRRFSAEYKRRILREADACTKPGELGALLRREGLYSSHLTSWRAQRDRAELEGLAPKQRGPKPKERNPLESQVRQLEREARKWQKRAERAEALVEVQKKVAELWGVTLATSDSDESDGSSS
jgi:transposase-like protein